MVKMDLLQLKIKYQKHAVKFSIKSTKQTLEADSLDERKYLGELKVDEMVLLEHRDEIVTLMQDIGRKYCEAKSNADKQMAQELYQMEHAFGQPDTLQSYLKEVKRLLVKIRYIFNPQEILSVSRSSISNFSQNAQRSTPSSIKDRNKSGAPVFQPAAGDCRTLVEAHDELPSNDDTLYSHDSKIIDAGQQEANRNMDSPSHANVASELVIQQNVERVEQSSLEHRASSRQESGGYSSSDERKTPTAQFARKSNNSKSCSGDSPKVANGSRKKNQSFNFGLKAMINVLEEESEVLKEFDERKPLSNKNEDQIFKSKKKPYVHQSQQSTDSSRQSKEGYENRRDGNLRSQKSNDSSKQTNEDYVKHRDGNLPSQKSNDSSRQKNQGYVRRHDENLPSQKSNDSSRRSNERFSSKQNDVKILSKWKVIDGEICYDPDIVPVLKAKMSFMKANDGITAAETVAATNVKEVIVLWSTKKVRLKLGNVILWPHGRDGDTIYAIFSLFSLDYQQHQPKAARDSHLQINEVSAPYYQYMKDGECRLALIESSNGNEQRQPLNSLYPLEINIFSPRECGDSSVTHRQ